MAGKPELVVHFGEQQYYPFSPANKELFLQSPERYTLDHVPTWPRSVVLFVGTGDPDDGGDLQELVQAVAAKLTSAESARVKTHTQPPITYGCPPEPQFPEVRPHPQPSCLA